MGSLRPEAAPPLQRVCEHCGAALAPGVSCADRFDGLLALDHSRAEPWGSRHGLAFAAFTLQHSRDTSTETIQRCLEMLHRVYVLGEDRAHVAKALRRDASSLDIMALYREPRAEAPNIFALTIDGMGEFAAETYAEELEAWCRATLDAWSQ